MTQRFSPEHLTIKPQAAGFRHWLKVLGELNWRVLPGSKQAVHQALQDPGSSAEKLTNLCLRDPLLCWLLSRRANTIVRDRDKWPGCTEQTITMLGLKQVDKIAAASEELSPLQLRDNGHCLSLEIINAGLTRQLFYQLCQLLKVDWYQNYSLSSLLYNLPELGLGIAQPDILQQLQVLQGHRHQASQAQDMLLGCEISAFAIPYGQQSPIQASCRDAWQLAAGTDWADAKAEALGRARRLAAGERQAIGKSPLQLLLGCRQLVAEQWHSGAAEALAILSGISGIPQSLLHKQLSKARLNMPWHPAIDRSLHPARWQLCHWQAQNWLPQPSQNQAAPSSELSAEMISLNRAAKSGSEQSMEIFKERLARLHSPQAFASIATLLAFTKHSLELGLKPAGAMVLICSQGKLKCRHSFGLRNYQAPLEINQAEFLWPLQKLFQEAGAAQLKAGESRLPQALRDCFAEGQFLGLQSIMVKTKPAALLIIAENRELSDQRMQLFTQFGHAFHKALLCQLGARTTAGR